MYLIRRISKDPATPIRIQVDAPQGDVDGGFGQGGVFEFQPAGEDGQPSLDGGIHQVGEAGAKAIMHDPGLAGHFECTPEPPAPDPAPEAEPEPKHRSRRKARPAGRGR